MSVVYFDTARLGQACPHVRQAQSDFNRLSADDPSMYGEEFFRDGSRSWSEEQLLSYPSFKDWEGIQSLKSQVATQFIGSTAHDNFLANRSAQLVRIAARLMFRNCRNVMTSDLNWPHWQSIILDEAARSGQRISVTPLQKEILIDHHSAEDVCERLLTMFQEKQCDGLFLPAVNNLGVRLPLDTLLPKLNATGLLRFSLLDAAQSFCHVTSPVPSGLADITITGCHKWLRGALPMGIAVCGSPAIADQVRAMLNSADLSSLDDPLLRFSQQLCGGRVDRFSETVNVAPLFTANAAIRCKPTQRSQLCEEVNRQSMNAKLIREAAGGTSWNALEVDESLHSGIVLMQSKIPRIQNMKSETLRSRFRQHGVALSAYSQGLIRLSAPKHKLSGQGFASLTHALTSIA